MKFYSMSWNGGSSKWKLMLQQGSLSTVMVDGHRGLRTGGLSQTVLQIKFRITKLSLLWSQRYSKIILPVLLQFRVSLFKVFLYPTEFNLQGWKIKIGTVHVLVIVAQLTVQQ
jgi:hypothetical protein